MVLKLYRPSESPGWLLKNHPSGSDSESHRVGPPKRISDRAPGDVCCYWAREHSLKVKSRLNLCWLWDIRMSIHVCWVFMSLCKESDYEVKDGTVRVKAFWQWKQANAILVKLKRVSQSPGGLLWMQLLEPTRSCTGPGEGPWVLPLKRSPGNMEADGVQTTSSEPCKTKTSPRAWKEMGPMTPGSEGPGFV